jgi:hypothetical protein
MVKLARLDGSHKWWTSCMSCVQRAVCTSAALLTVLISTVSQVLLLRLLYVLLLQAFRVLLQQRVSAVAVLAGAGSSVNMRLVGNLSASDLRHLRRGGFGVLALSVKQFLASKPLAPDQVGLQGSSSSTGCV